MIAALDVRVAVGDDVMTIVEKNLGTTELVTQLGLKVEQLGFRQMEKIWVVIADAEIGFVVHGRELGAADLVEKIASMLGMTEEIAVGGARYRASSRLGAGVLDDATLVFGAAPIVQQVFAAAEGTASRVADSDGFGPLLDKVGLDAAAVFAYRGEHVDKIREAAVSVQLADTLRIAVHLDAADDVIPKIQASIAELTRALNDSTPAILRSLVKGEARRLTGDRSAAGKLDLLVGWVGELSKNLTMFRREDGLHVTTFITTGVEAMRTGGVLQPVADVVAAAMTVGHKRAQTVEAIDNLDRMAKGAASYFATSDVDASGASRPCHFPATVACVPKSSPCDHPDGMYPADPNLWTHPTFKALGFEVEGPHRFRYCFESKGTGPNAEFIASAHADLDCDGTWSTFQRMGFGKQGAEGERCPIATGAAFYVENETE